MIVRPVFAALSAACLAMTLAAISDGALAQSKMAPAAPPHRRRPRHRRSSEAAADQADRADRQADRGRARGQKEMDPIIAKITDNAKPDPKITAQLEGIAKKNGFASYDEYNNVVDNISIVLGGFDPATKKYVGVETVIKAQIAQVQADKKMSAKDKKEALAELNDVLKTPPPAIENKGNIDLVAKYYDKLADEFGGNDQD